jgi:hypothetical protein
MLGLLSEGSDEDRLNGVQAVLGEPLVPFVEETGTLVSLLVWLAFGAIAVAAFAGPELAAALKGPVPIGTDRTGVNRLRLQTQGHPREGDAGILFARDTGSVRAFQGGRRNDAIRAGCGHPGAGHRGGGRYQADAAAGGLGS